MEQTSRNSPIRLEVAAKLAFPDGAVKTPALREQIKIGRLVAWEISGKHFTSLFEIDRMLEKCRVIPSRPASGSESLERPKADARRKKAFTSSSTVDVSTARDAARATARALRERLRNSSPPSTKYPDVDGK